jgi:DegV family protein with EDD domain
MPGRIAIVTDSTSSLPPEVALARGITVVPLQVVIGGTSYDEGADGATPDAISAALKEWTPVSTSRPTPARMLETYEALAAHGAKQILSIHLSGDMSGTFESAQLAAKDSPVPVTAVDTRQVGIGTGFSVLTAADVLDDGGSVEQAAAAALVRSASTTSLFYVDTLEHIRRGGRINVATAILGTALAVKPLLRIHEGRIEPFEKVRTAAKALARLEELAVAAAGDHQVEVAVAHLASADRAGALQQHLTARLADNLGERVISCGELGAVLGAHVGPGMVAVCVAPLL